MAEYFILFHLLDGVIEGFKGGCSVCPVDKNSPTQGHYEG
jgi:hypothetical protein